MDFKFMRAVENPVEKTVTGEKDKISEAKRVKKEKNIQCVKYSIFNVYI